MKHSNRDIELIGHAANYNNEQSTNTSDHAEELGTIVKAKNMFNDYKIYRLKGN
jgi:hypothetical protein